MSGYEGAVAPLARALAQRGYTDLTPVQAAVLGDEMRDRDALVSAQTGSGKTVAFGLAIAPTLLGEDEKFLFADVPLALIVAPTRELALQVKRELEWLYAEAGAQVASCVGGMDYRTERRALERGAHIVVGTPGRLKDHIERGSLDLSGIRAVVLDEADEMLDLGFSEDLEFILGASPETRRTLMFSATVPKAIAGLAQKYQRDAVRIQTAGEQKQHVDIEYRALSVSPRDRENAIINVLRYYEAQTALVFCTTRAAVNHLMGRFHNRGFSVVALSGELSQHERTHALQAMRDGRARVCIATDVAARGIDLPGLELVIHADLPTNSETLLHRSGRTGRAGNKGVSALIVTPKDFKKAQRLLQGARVTPEWGPAPTADEVNARDDLRLMESEHLMAPVAEEEAAMVEALVARHGAKGMAAGFLRLWRAGRSAPEELSGTGTMAEEVRRPREEFGDSVWFSISVGRAGRAEARWILPKLCDLGQITKHEIGAIRVQENNTFVQIARGVAESFVANLGPGMELEKGVALTRLAGEPVLERPERPGAGGRADRKPRDDRKPAEVRASRDEPPPPADRAERKPRTARAARPEPVEKAPYVAPPEVAPIEGKKAYRASKYENREPFKPARRVGVKPARRDDREGATDDRPKPAPWKQKAGAPGKSATRYPERSGTDRPAAKFGGTRPAGKYGDAKPDGAPDAARPKGKYGKDKPSGKTGTAPGGKFAGSSAEAKPSRKGFGSKPDVSAGTKPPVNAADPSQRLKPRTKPRPKR